MTVLQQSKNQSLNSTVYVDYENVFEFLQKHGANPIKINFFSTILDKLRHDYQLNIIECVVYCDFEKDIFQGKHQTALQKLGLQTRHSAFNGKNCGDLMLTVDALRTLYKNPNVGVFVIISSDRDLIPLLKAVKYENKITCVIVPKYGFNLVVSNNADYYEYIEDIFNLTPEMLIPDDTEVLDCAPSQFTEEDIANAKEVTRLLFSSKVWRTFETEGEPVTLKGYVQIISKKIMRSSEQIIKDFELAHHFKYITIYKDQTKGLCLRKGTNIAAV